MISQLFIFWSNLKTQLRVIYLQDKIAIFLFLFSLILNLALYIIFIVFVDSGTDQIILHYNIYFGIDLLGSWYNLYIMPAVGSFLLLTNFCLLFFVYKREQILGYFLGAVSILVELLLLIGGSLLLWLNF
ncbi:MAG: hypothetical protein WC310_03745 [Patescibacteria group bacterium]|jgi:hypothetical protein